MFNVWCFSKKLINLLLNCIIILILMVIFIKFNGILNFKIIYFISVVRKSFNWIRNMIEYACINKII